MMFVFRSFELLYIIKSGQSLSLFKLFLACALIAALLVWMGRLVTCEAMTLCLLQNQVRAMLVVSMWLSNVLQVITIDHGYRGGDLPPD
jgi:hypothetical protein